MAQTQKPLHHTLGRKIRFFPARIQTFPAQPRERCHRRAQGVLRDWMCRSNPQGLGAAMPCLYCQESFVFPAEEVKILPAPAQLEETHVGLVQQLWIPPKPWIQTEKWELRGRGKMNCTRQGTNHSFSEQDTKIHLFVSL